MSLKTQHLAMMKRYVGYFHDGTAIISRNTPATGDSFYPDDVFAAVGTVICRLLPENRTNRTEATIALQEKGKTYYTGSFPDTADIRDRDKVSIAGISYEVVMIDPNRTDKTDKQALLVMIGNGT